MHYKLFHKSGVGIPNLYYLVQVENELAHSVDGGLAEGVGLLPAPVEILAQ